jgi:hypothetical protein
VCNSLQAHATAQVGAQKRRRENAREARVVREATDARRADWEELVDAELSSYDFVPQQPCFGKLSSGRYPVVVVATQKCEFLADPMRKALGWGIIKLVLLLRKEAIATTEAQLAACSTGQRSATLGRGKIPAVVLFFKEAHKKASLWAFSFLLQHHHTTRW